MNLPIDKTTMVLRTKHLRPKGVNMIEFVSYDGAYPNYCRGTLVLRVEGVEVTMPEFCLRSGGTCFIDSLGDEVIESGRWFLDDYYMPEHLLPFIDEMEEVVNANITMRGCCGGCL